MRSLLPGISFYKKMQYEGKCREMKPPWFFLVPVLLPDVRIRLFCLRAGPARSVYSEVIFVNNAVLVGMYAAQSSAGKLGVPILPDCAGWQAWKTPEGELFLQPVDAGGLPVGSLTVLEEEDLQKYFVALDTPFTATASSHANLLYANDPDLLYWWLEKNLEEKKGGGAAAPDDGRRVAVEAPAAIDPATIFPQSLGTDAPPSTAVEEGAVTGVPTDTAAPASTQPFAVSFTFTASPVAGSPTFTAEATAADPAPLAAPSGEAVAPDAYDTLTPSEEERARILENAARVEFDMLLDRWRAAPSIENATLVGALLARPGKFGWQQKYMFSEFGLALRKEKLHSLALQSHLRALELSPQDEHVLFNVARSLNELGRVAEAREHLRRALSIAPDFETARHFLQFLEGALPPV